MSTVFQSNIYEINNKIGDNNDNIFDIENDADGILSEENIVKILALTQSSNELKIKEEELEELCSAAITQSKNSIDTQLVIIKSALDELKYSLGSHVVISI